MKQIAIAMLALAALAVSSDAVANPDRADRDFTGARDFLATSSFDLFGRPAQQIALESRLLVADTDALNELGVSPLIGGVTLITQEADGSTGVYRTGVDASTGMIYMGNLFGQTPDFEAEPSNPVGLGFLFGDQLLIDIRPGNSVPYDPTAIDSNAALTDKFLDEFGRISESSFGMPRVAMQDLPTQVLITDETSIIMGFEPGLREYREPTDIPLLGDVPLLRPLFVGRVSETQRRELIVHITPTIVPDTE
jgi:hypothetical protein